LCFYKGGAKLSELSKLSLSLSHLEIKTLKKTFKLRFAENSQLNPTLFTRINQEIATDPRITSWIPDVGEFGDSGQLRGKNVTTGKPVVEGYTKKPGQLIPLGTGSQTNG